MISDSPKHFFDAFRRLAIFTTPYIAANEHFASIIGQIHLTQIARQGWGWQQTVSCFLSCGVIQHEYLSSNKFKFPKFAGCFTPCSAGHRYNSAFKKAIDLVAN
jgi:hypothetical protein